MRKYVFHSPIHTDGRRVTIVGILNEENGDFNVSASICSPTDNYSKKLGVEIAEGRALKGKCVKTLKTAEPISNKEFIEAIALPLSRNIDTLIDKIQRRPYGEHS